MDTPGQSLSQTPGEMSGSRLGPSLGLASRPASFKRSVIMSEKGG
jgi:hypothetical protein